MPGTDLPVDRPITRIASRLAPLGWLDLCLALATLAWRLGVLYLLVAGMMAGMLLALDEWLAAAFGATHPAGIAWLDLLGTYIDQRLAATTGLAWLLLVLIQVWAVARRVQRRATGADAPLLMVQRWARRPVPVDCIEPCSRWRALAHALWPSFPSRRRGFSLSLWRSHRLHTARGRFMFCPAETLPELQTLGPRLSGRAAPGLPRRMLRALGAGAGDLARLALLAVLGLGGVMLWQVTMALDENQVAGSPWLTAYYLKRYPEMDVRHPDSLERHIALLTQTVRRGSRSSFELAVAHVREGLRGHAATPGPWPKGSVLHEGFNLRRLNERQLPFADLVRGNPGSPEYPALLEALRREGLFTTRPRDRVPPPAVAGDLWPHSDRAPLLSVLLELPPDQDLDTAHWSSETERAAGAQKLERILRADPRPQRADATGWSMLHSAAALGHPQALAVLLRHGARVDSRNWLGETPLMVARDAGVAELLHAAGADRKARDRRGRSVAFHHLLRGVWRPDTLQAWLAAHPDDMGLTEAGETWLHAAAIGHGAALVPLLVQAGVDPATPRRDGATALHLSSDPAMTEALLRAGAPLHARDQAGRTPLHLAYAAGHDALCAVLLRHGADPQALDQDGKRPEDLASGGKAKSRRKPAT